MKYYCQHCFYVYDEDKGEPDCDIPPKTSISSLPYDYECPLCHNSKESFISEKTYFSNLS